MDQQEGLFGPLHESKPAVRTVPASRAKIVRVAFDSAGDNVFDYALPEELRIQLKPGQRVRAPLGRGNRVATGFCVEFPEQSNADRLKTILEVVDEEPLLNDSLMELAGWISSYYCCPLGVVLSAMVPAAVKQKAGLVRKSHVRLTELGRNYIPGSASDLRLSAKGRSIVEYLSGRGGKKGAEYPLADIMAVLQCREGPFRTLAKAGLVEIVKREEFSSGAFGSPLDEREVCPFDLNRDQKNILGQMAEILEKESFQTMLLYGVTGSGKTEIYIRCIEKVLARGRQALVLLPEIGLTLPAMRRFQEHFQRVAILHSGLSGAQRHKQWRQIADGQADVVVGARSAVFAPLAKLGIIVVDEEHDSSYKQDSNPRYHGRDVAVKRAQILGIPVILGSATPSLESWNNCQSKSHYHLFSLPRRVLDLPLPKVKIVDMSKEALERKGRHLLSRLLEEEIRRCLKRKKQAILLLNRRGHSHYIFCPSCDFAVSCPNCDVSLTYYRSQKEFEDAPRGWVMCHYCLHSSRVPRLCPVCGKKLLLIGPGIQQAEEEIKAKFPRARLVRVDSDSIKPGDFQKILVDFEKGQIDILAGTQMIGKGLDFPNVELVGVINADTALSLPDFRSSERTFQLIAQVAGRCGRVEDTGRVIVQSFLPEDEVIVYACRHDYQQFVRYELEIRRRCQLPPYFRLARIILRDKKLARVEQAGIRLRRVIDTLQETATSKVDVRGPVPAGISRIENYHRQEIILKAAGAEAIQKLLHQLREKHLFSLGVRAVVDVDPVVLF